MSSLIALDTADEVEFTYLRNFLNLTDGNLGAHLTKLENTGYIKIKNTYNSFCYDLNSAFMLKTLNKKFTIILIVTFLRPKNVIFF
jgi:hypothetical protein